MPVAGKRIKGFLAGAVACAYQRDFMSEGNQRLGNTGIGPFGQRCFASLPAPLATAVVAAAATFDYRRLTHACQLLWQIFSAVEGDPGRGGHLQAIQQTFLPLSVDDCVQSAGIKKRSE